MNPWVFVAAVYVLVSTMFILGLCKAAGDADEAMGCK